MRASGLFAITPDTIIGRNRYHIAAGNRVGMSQMADHVNFRSVQQMR